MDNKVFYKNEEAIISEKNNVIRIAKVLQENTKKLSRMNKEQFLMDESLVFDLTFCNHGGLKRIEDHFLRANPMTSTADIERLVECLSDPDLAKEHYPRIKGLPTITLEKYSPVIANRKLTKEDFTKDLKPSKAILQEIENYYTFTAETPQQANYIALLEELEAVLQKISKAHAKKGLSFNAWDYIRQITLTDDPEFKLDKLFIAELYLPLMK